MPAGDFHVIRNAGGRVDESAIRSLVISQRLLGTNEIFIIHHTNCGMETFGGPLNHVVADACTLASAARVEWSRWHVSPCADPADAWQHSALLLNDGISTPECQRIASCCRECGPEGQDQGPTWAWTPATATGCRESFCMLQPLHVSPHVAPCCACMPTPQLPPLA